MLIINADDFGLNKQVNLGILESFKKGFCSSATIMPNGRDFEHACELIRQNKLVDRIGMHLVLRGAEPLSGQIKRYREFCDVEGVLSFDPRSFFISLDSLKKYALAQEIKAQINRCRNAGLTLTHIDSHHSLHTIWAVTSVLAPIMREEKIPYLRLKSNCDLHALPLRFKVYTQCFNYRLRVLKLARTRYMGSIQHYLLLRNRLGESDAVRGSFEVCVHPSLNQANKLIDIFFEEEMDLERQVKRIPGWQGSVSFLGAGRL